MFYEYWRPKKKNLGILTSNDWGKSLKFKQQVLSIGILSETIPLVGT